MSPPVPAQYITRASARSPEGVVLFFGGGVHYILEGGWWNAQEVASSILHAFLVEAPRPEIVFLTCKATVNSTSRFGFGVVGERVEIPGWGANEPNGNNPGAIPANHSRARQVGGSPTPPAPTDYWIAPHWLEPAAALDPLI